MTPNAAARGPESGRNVGGATLNGAVSLGESVDSEVLARRPVTVAANALANKIARVAWALRVSGTRYREPGPQAV